MASLKLGSVVVEDGKRAFCEWRAIVNLFDYDSSIRVKDEYPSFSNIVRI